MNAFWRRVLLIVGAAALAGAAARAHPPTTPLAPWEAATAWPDRIIVNPGADPQTSLSVTWRTDASVTATIAELVEASADSRFDLAATVYPARYERVDLEAAPHAHSRGGPPNAGRGAVHYHAVTFEDLRPDTLYAYRVRGARGHWSSWSQVRTAPADGAVTFLYVGDGQYGLRSHTARVFRQALLTAPEADFFLHAGDLVNHGERDTEWAEWFDAGGFIPATIPVVPVAGNHEYLETAEGGAKDGKAILTALWRPHFTLPIAPDLPDALQETVYDLRYSRDLHVFVLDSSSPLWAEQMDWLVTKANASDARWKLAALHHSPYRPGIQGYANNPERGAFHRARQDQFIAASNAAGIDMILAGHNHSYTRASVGERVGPVLPDPDAAPTLRAPRAVDQVVVVAISGGMSGRMTPQRFAANQNKFGDGIALERWATNTPTYQVITVDGASLAYTAYTAVGEAYDAFTVMKAEDGVKTLTNGAAALGPVRNFETTGPYREKHSLR